MGRTSTALPRQTLRKRRGAACLNGRGETKNHTSIMSRNLHMDGSTVCDSGDFFFLLLGVFCHTDGLRHTPPRIAWPSNWRGMAFHGLTVTRSVLNYMG